MSLFARRRTPERLVKLGVSRGRAGDHEGAERALLSAAREWVVALERPDADQLAIVAKLTGCHAELGHLARRTGRLTEALEQHQRAVSFAERLEGDGHPAGSTALGTARHNVAEVLVAMARLTGAATVLRQTVPLRKRLCANASGDPAAGVGYAESLLLDAVVQRRLGNRRLAAQSLDTAEAIATNLGRAGVDVLERVATEYAALVNRPHLTPDPPGAMP